MASLVAQRLKHLPAMRETWVWSLGREDPLEKEMVTHSSILARRIPWMEDPGGLQSTGLQSVGHDWATSLSLCSKGPLEASKSSYLSHPIYPFVQFPSHSPIYSFTYLSYPSTIHWFILHSVIAFSHITHEDSVVIFCRVIQNPFWCIFLRFTSIWTAPFIKIWTDAKYEDYHTRAREWWNFIFRSHDKCLFVLIFRFL